MKHYLTLLALCFYALQTFAQTSKLIEIHPDSVSSDASIIETKTTDVLPVTNALQVNDKKKIKEPKVFSYVEQMPEFKGGDAALIKFLQQKIKYPKKAQEMDIQGKVLIRFVVNETGKVSDISVLRGVEQSLNDEAVRVVKSFPKFKPGKQQGKAVKVYFNLPIVFKLQ